MELFGGPVERKRAFTIHRAVHQHSVTRIDDAHGHTLGGRTVRKPALTGNRVVAVVVAVTNWRMRPRTGGRGQKRRGGTNACYLASIHRTSSIIIHRSSLSAHQHSAADINR